tara:strand:- start:594 stop:755 length:162 start_codon:yes stop_codon:yes gene_type:complete
MKAIIFLTKTTYMSDYRRQEFKLLSDVLGVSILLAAIKKNKKTQFRIRTKHLS